MAALTLAAGVKASASQDQARQSSTCDGAGNGSRNECDVNDSNACAPKGRWPVEVIQTTSVPRVVDPFEYKPLRPVESLMRR
jgi:hypothetical protein